jgi:hypothetical protein
MTSTVTAVFRTQDSRRRFEHREMFASLNRIGSPPGPDMGQPHPEPPVRCREPRPPRPRSLQHLQCVVQREHLELKCGPRTRTPS